MTTQDDPSSDNNPAEDRLAANQVVSNQVVEDLFLEVVELPPAERSDFLQQRCGENQLLYDRVQALVRADEEAGGDDFLQSAVFAKPGVGSGSDSSLPPNSDDDAADIRPLDPDRFNVVARYREGGLGEVLIAYDKQLKRDVALKMIRPKWGESVEARRRFIQEAEVTGRLEHPGVVPVYAMGQWQDGKPYYAMRFIEGITFAEAIQKYHQSVSQDGLNHGHADNKVSTGNTGDESTQIFDLRGLLNRFVDVCNTIHYAHSRHVLHRDIKPSNIMVGPYGETLVVDWGLAKLLDEPEESSLTEQLMGDDSHAMTDVSAPRGRVGTPQYMSPEQASGQHDEITRRTDVYLLGATLYQVLANQAPHQLAGDDDSVHDLLRRVAVGDLVDPSRINPGFAPELRSICLKAMATSAADRYRSASDLADDIDRWLADEPVLAHPQTTTARVLRWSRRHQSAVYSGVVALLLITVSSIIGSVLVTVERTRRIRLASERNVKAAALDAAVEARLTKLQSSSSASVKLAEQELQAGRYSSALGFFRSAMGTLENEPDLTPLLEPILKRAEQLERIVRFRQFADECRERNVMSNDAEAMVASMSALQAIGVWDREDWWNALPVGDLNAAQIDRLRWEVYQQLIVLDALLVKSIGTRLAGSQGFGGGTSLLPAIRRFLRTSIGKREAAAAIVLSDRLDRFRLSESVRWYRSVAEFRLGTGRRVDASELGVTTNAPDAQGLGVMSMLAALDPGFAMFFSGYQGDDNLLAAQDLFGRASTLSPDSYWNQLSLAQVDYLVSERSEDASWRKYDRAIQTIGRCIAMDDQRCFAFADRSSIYRYKSRLVASDQSMDESLRSQRVSELRSWSMTDAQTAFDLSGDESWVGWQYGLALHEVGKQIEANDAFLNTSILTHPLLDLTDVTFVAVDDIRGRSEVAEIIESQTQVQTSVSGAFTLLASIRLNQGRIDEASQAVDVAINTKDPSAHAYAVRGMLRVQSEDYEAALRDFQRSLAGNPNHQWSYFGLATCYESRQKHAAAFEAYRSAAKTSQTTEHRAAALLGQARSLFSLTKFDESMKLVGKARQLEPAVNLVQVMKPLVTRFAKFAKSNPDSDLLDPMKSYLQQIAALPRVSRIEVPQTPIGSYQAALLNGDFELDSMKYWNDKSGASWFNDDGFRSSAIVTSESGQSGSRCLKIIAAGSSRPAQMASDEEGPSQQGRTSQTIPLDADSRYELSLLAKSQGTKSGTLTVRVGGEPLLKLPSGDFGWQEFRVQFSTADSDQQQIIPVLIEIAAAGKGTVWLDQIQVVRRMDSSAQ